MSSDLAAPTHVHKLAIGTHALQTGARTIALIATNTAQTYVLIDFLTGPTPSNSWLLEMRLNKLYVFELQPAILSLNVLNATGIVYAYYPGSSI